MEKRAVYSKVIIYTLAFTLSSTGLLCNRSDTLVENGAVNLELGDYTRARIAYGKAVDKYPQLASARLGLGKALLQEFYARSDSSTLLNCLTQLEAARSLRPDSTVQKLLGSAWFKRADGLLAHRDTIAAMQALSRSISLDASSIKSVNLAGILYFHRGEHDKALNLFRKVVTIDSASASGYFNTGMVYWADSNTAAAYDCFFKAAQRSPGDREILLWAARTKQPALQGK